MEISMDKYTKDGIESELTAVLDLMINEQYYPLLSQSQNNLTFQNYILDIVEYKEYDLLKILYRLTRDELQDIRFGLKKDGLTGFFQVLFEKLDYTERTSRDKLNYSFFGSERYYCSIIGSISAEIIDPQMQIHLTSMSDDIGNYFVPRLDKYNKYPWENSDDDDIEHYFIQSLYKKYNKHPWVRRGKKEPFYTEEESEEARKKIARELCYIITDALSFNHEKIYNEPDTFIGSIKVGIDCKIYDELYEAITLEKQYRPAPEQKTIEIHYKDIIPHIVKFLREDCRIEKDSDAEIELYSEMGQYAFSDDEGWRELINKVISIFVRIVECQLVRWLNKWVRSFIQTEKIPHFFYIKSIDHSAKQQINFVPKFFISAEKAINDEEAYKGKLFLECGKTIHSDEEKELFNTMFMLNKKLKMEKEG